MKKSELIKRLFSSNEEEVLIEIKGLLYEIEAINHHPEEFDGFFMACPAALGLKPEEI